MVIPKRSTQEHACKWVHDAAGTEPNDRNAKVGQSCAKSRKEEAVEETAGSGVDGLWEMSPAQGSVFVLFFPPCVVSRFFISLVSAKLRKVSWMAGRMER